MSPDERFTDLVDRIAAAPTSRAIVDLWEAHYAHWAPEHEAVAALRQREIAAAVHSSARSGKTNRLRDVAVGDRLLVTVAPRVAPEADLYEPPELVSAVVTVDEVTVMHCGCSRAGFARPGPAGWGPPNVHVFSPGCRFVDRDQTVDFSAARDAARTQAGAA